jgi:hypothetical protein
MLIPRSDPGICIICGAAHCACVPGGIVVQQLPASAAAECGAAGSSPPLVADTVQATLPVGQFTSGTYRRRPRSPR